MHIIVVGIAISSISSFQMDQHRLQHAWRNLIEGIKSRDYNSFQICYNYQPHLVLVQATMPCKQLVTHVTEWGPFRNPIEKKCIEAPIVNSLKTKRKQSFL